MKYKFVSGSLDETHTFAKELGSQLRGGEIIQLIGDIGAGKTTFVRGLAEGIGSVDHVSSPTFTVCNIYKGRIDMYHCDFYRLNDDKLIEKEIAELIDGESVLVLEWADKLAVIKQLDQMIVDIKVNADDSRVFDVGTSDSYNYISL